jgi:hypothetical protein
VEALFRTLTFYLASGVEAAALVITLATLEAVFGALWLYFARPPSLKTARSRCGSSWGADWPWNFC